MRDLSRRALSGVASNWAGSAVLIVAQIVSTAATARLLAPREFGYYATGQAAIGLAGYFTMNALGSGLLRRGDFGPRTIGTAFLLSLTSATVVSLSICMLAPLWAAAWHVSEAAHIVRLLAVALFLTSLSTVPVALMRRHLHFGKAAFIEVAAQVIGLAVSVALAVRLHSATALAVGQLIGAALLVGWSLIVCRSEIQVAFDRNDAKELFTFATQISGLGFGSYVTMTAPSWFAAREFGSAVLGVYSRANLMVALPLTYLSASIMRVLYPLYGRLRSDPTRTRLLIAEGLILTTGVAWPSFAFVSGAAPCIVRIFLGPRWHAAAPLLTLCVLAACASLPCGLLTNAAEAFGWMRVIVSRQVGFLSGVGASLVITLLLHLSMIWLLWGVAFSQWVTYIWTVRMFLASGHLRLSAVVRSHGVHGVIALCVYALAAGTTEVLHRSGTLEQLLGEVVVAVVSLCFIGASRKRIPAAVILKHRLSVARTQASSSASVA